MNTVNITNAVNITNVGDVIKTVDRRLLHTNTHKTTVGKTASSGRRDILNFVVKTLLQDEKGGA